MNIDTLLLIVAAISFGLATFGVTARINLVGLGLSCVTLTLLI